ncbi:TlpA family protein disulfide reductase [Pedobacter sp. JCM 36344]|uniref:TlpA family protein disulfide reductase n=1 Tax=Pedobacter sp. JCM 36344 TaxID=3374280 RepID=UPI003978C545
MKMWCFLILFFSANSYGQRMDAGMILLKNSKLPKTAVLNSTVDLNPEDPMRSILQKHKGAIVYVDIWATWCGPCLAEMSNSKKLRNKLQGKDVVFVYLCINSPSENRWKKLICSKQMAGENYFFDQQYSAALSERYKVKTIPRYILFDQNGDAVSEDAKRPGEDAVLRTINGML